MKHLNQSFVIIIITIFSLLIINCNKESSTSPPVEQTAKEIIPLKVGNYWSYSRTLYDSVGNIQDTSSYITTITGTTSINGIQYYNYDNKSTYFVNKTAGYYISENSVDRLIFKYPASVGDSTNYGKYTSTNSSIQVPAGNFTGCYRYETVPISDKVNYFKPGVGLVYATEKSGREVYQLTSYKVE